MEHRREPKSSRRGRYIHPEMESIEERVLLSRLGGAEGLGATAVIDLLGHSRSAMIRGRDHGSPPATGSHGGGLGFVRGPLVRVSGPSPFADCPVDAGGTDETVTLNSAVEPRLAVDPRNPNHLVGVWQQDRWSGFGARGIVAGVSFNGGRNWRMNVIPGLTTCSGGTYSRVSDPWVAFGAYGTVYVSSLPFNATGPTGGGGESGVYVSKSNDGGRTWGRPTLLIALPNALAQTDKDSITVDRHHPRFAYVPWETLEIPPQLIGFRAPAMLARTTDGGRTWEPARTFYDPGLNAGTINHQIFVQPGGTLIDTFTEFRAVPAPQSPTGFRLDSTLSVLRSKDRGLTWGPEGSPYRAAELQGIEVTDPDTGQLVRTAGSPSGFPTEFPDVAMDPRTGRLYAVWQDARFSGFQYDDIAFAISADGGRTWSSPIRINQTPRDIPPQDRQAFNPTIQIAADGTLAVSYYDFRFNDAAPGVPTDAWVAFCRPGRDPSTCTDPSRWGGEVRLTDHSFDLERAPLAEGGYFLGDYEGLGTAGRSFLAFFAQTSDVNPAEIVFRRVGPAHGQGG